MQRVMIIGQPGSGKSTLARAMGDITNLPVVHMDMIHWQSGWVERPRPQKDVLCAEVHARDKWIFEGGHSATWPERLNRCDTLIWLDFQLGIRARRVFWRTMRSWGQSRPDLPPDCPEQVSFEFYQWIWNTRHSAKSMMLRLYQSAPASKTTLRLCNPHDVTQFLGALRDP